mmetsp:Transcript_22130/g.74434  ORF Transcript_22130/g.74434 Transcript_22130/m.74434 type:complete len:215 (+) Transcript_22130:183-827(+)
MRAPAPSESPSGRRLRGLRPGHDRAVPDGVAEAGCAHEARVGHEHELLLPGRAVQLPGALAAALPHERGHLRLVQALVCRDHGRYAVQGAVPEGNLYAPGDVPGLLGHPHEPLGLHALAERAHHLPRVRVEAHLRVRPRESLRVVPEALPADEHEEEGAGLEILAPAGLRAEDHSLEDRKLLLQACVEVRVAAAERRARARTERVRRQSARRGP